MLYICRVCLTENVHYLIENTQLQDIYEKLTARPLQTKDMRPRSVCYICYAQLQTTHKFMMKCLKAENALTQMLEQLQNNKQKVDLQAIIDKWSPKTSQFTISVVEQNNIDTDIDDVIIKQEIKQEYDEGIYTQHAYEHKATAATKIKKLDITDALSKRTVIEKPSVYNLCLGDHYDHITNIKLIKVNDNDASYNDAISSNSNKIPNQKRDTENVIIDLISSDDNLPSDKQDNNRKNVSKAVPNKSYPCHICEETFTQVWHLRKHMRTIHKDEALYICDICGRSYRRKCDIINHLKVHPSKTPPPCDCDICQGDGKTPNLEESDTNLSRKGPYFCDVCFKGFTYKCRLRKHSRTHTKMPHVCNICHTKFKARYRLVRHMNIHTRKILYSCDVCHKTFTQNEHLLRHSKIHTREKPYSCEVCKRKFRFKKRLAKHRDKCQTSFKEESPESPITDTKIDIDENSKEL